VTKKAYKTQRSYPLSAGDVRCASKMIRIDVVLLSGECVVDPTHEVN